MPLSKEKKAAYVTKMEDLLEKYTKIFTVSVNNVGSQQMQLTRLQMRGTAEILMGKNTLMRKILNGFLEKNPGHPLEAFLPQVVGNVGFVFTNADLPRVRDFILANKVPAPAKIGAIAPTDVDIPAGPTGCDPGQTNFFQVLQIPTKIVKGQIEITNLVHLVKAGNKVGSSEAALLAKLSIRPFAFGLTIKNIYDNGSIFGPEVLDITNAVLAAHFGETVKAIASISLLLGYPTQASVPHSIAGAFNACVGIALNLPTYSFKEAEKFAAFIKDPSAFAVAAPAAAGGKAPAAAAAPVAAVEEVDPMEGGMDMFGGGGSDY
jgi:large subunit ribosomal protein LP0